MRADVEPLVLGDAPFNHSRGGGECAALRCHVHGCSCGLSQTRQASSAVEFCSILQVTINALMTAAPMPAPLCRPRAHCQPPSWGPRFCAGPAGAPSAPAAGPRGAQRGTAGWCGGCGRPPCVLVWQLGRCLPAGRHGGSTCPDATCQEAGVACASEPLNAGACAGPGELRPA